MRVATRSRKRRSWVTTTSAPRRPQQELFEPGDRLDVEVVGGLVEQQQIGVGAPARAPARRACACRPTARRPRRRRSATGATARCRCGASAPSRRSASSCACRAASRSSASGRGCASCPIAAASAWYWAIVAALPARPAATASNTVCAGSSCGSCGTNAIAMPLCRAIWPSSKASAPAIPRSSDDLPVPLRPISARRSPASIDRSAPSRSATCPYAR